MNTLQQFLLESNIRDLRKTLNLGGRLEEYPITIMLLDVA